MSTISVYFDESGYTGENLLKEDQPTFSYATVKINNKKAEKLVSDILKKYPKQTQSGELKATILLKTQKGREAIYEILDAIQNDIKISVSDKKYALVCKFFEYMIEPVIAPKSTIFYSLNFHKYVSNVLYMSLVVGQDKLTIELFNKFEILMRNKRKTDFNNLLVLIDTNIQPESEDFIKKLLLFIQIHQDIIWDEIKDLPKWTVDLSITTLNALFNELGKNGDEIIAYCDNSKPLFEQKEIFNKMIGRKDIIFHPFIENNGEKIPMTYNLKELNLVDSKEYKAVQLADIVAGTASYLFKMFDEEKDTFSIELKNMLLKNIIYGSIFPDFEELNLEKKSVQLNALFFEYLTKVSEEKVDILEGIEEYLIYMNNTLDKHPFLETKQ
ncbi:MAG: DUF3800 domain-containing protein [Sulfurovum sp.]|nr:DUF3800 domain-containing protein [Sulfurovum sp.]MCB4763842.1 DUF3800 domain-containing protein [Sulfurovum sp.]